MSEQNRHRLRAAGIAALAWAGLAAVWTLLVPGEAAELPQGTAGIVRSLLVLPLSCSSGAHCSAFCARWAGTRPFWGRRCSLRPCTAP